MTLRSVKRAQRQAKLVLIRRHGYRESDFFRATGEESIYASKTLRVHQRERGWFMRLLPGTWLYGAMSGYYEPEWDEKLPTDLLDHIRFCEKFPWEKEASKRGADSMTTERNASLRKELEEELERVSGICSDCFDLRRTEAIPDGFICAWCCDWQRDKALLHFLLAKLDQCNGCGGEGFIPAGPSPFWMIPCPICTPELELLEADFVKREG